MSIVKESFVFVSILVLSSALTTTSAKYSECIECHGELTNLTQHRIAQKNCNMCHADHDVITQNDYRLKKPVNFLCLACHKNIAKGHLVHKHPISGDRDPLYPEKKFNCVSCHNPHQSKMPKLFRYDYSKETTPYLGEPCALCHGKIYGLPANLPVPPRNVYGD